MWGGSAEEEQEEEQQEQQEQEKYDFKAHLAGWSQLARVWATSWEFLEHLTFYLLVIVTSLEYTANQT